MSTVPPPGVPGDRPARRSLGLPGQSRDDEWLEPAYPVEPVPDAWAPAEPVPDVWAPAEPVPEVWAPTEAEPVAAIPEQPGAPEAPETSDACEATEATEATEASEVALRPGLEAVLMVADEPITEARLAEAVQYPRAEVAAALRELAAEYAAQDRGFELRLVAGGWRYYSSAACAPVVDRFVLDGQQARLTQAALETLAVVAYRQPVSRSRVSAVRGVNCDGVMRTLVQRGLVEETGTEPETGAILYRTTSYFLERMGLRGLDELPELAPFLPEVDDVEAESLEGTAIADAVAAASAREAQ
ncbi:segregation and condensation protein B [Kitasatospora acidiphila]